MNQIPRFFCKKLVQPLCYSNSFPTNRYVGWFSSEICKIVSVNLEAIIQLTL